MDSKKPNDCSYAEKRKVTMQLKRRNTYTQVSTHKREALLLSRHLKTDSTRHYLVENPTISTPTQPTSSCYREAFPKRLHLSSENLKRFLRKRPSPSSTNSTPEQFRQRKTSMQSSDHFSNK